MWMQSCFKSGFWNAFWNTKKMGVLDRDPPRKPDSRTCECKAPSERDSCVCIFKMPAEAMHKRMGQSAHVDCAVGAKYYLTVCRSWSWFGSRLHCMWTHIVQITIPITFWIAIRNVFRNVILSHVNTAYIAKCGLSGSNGQVHNLKIWMVTLDHALGTSSPVRLLVESALFAFSKTAYGKELGESLKC